MFIERRVMERNLLGGKGTLILLVKYVECLLKTIQQKLQPLNLLLCKEERLKHFSFLNDY